MAIEIGQTAPAFTLHASDKSKVSLADYKGKNVLLIFFTVTFYTRVSFEEAATPTTIIDTGTGYEIASQYAKLLAPGQTRTYTISVSTSLGLFENIIETFTLRSALAI